MNNLIKSHKVALLTGVIALCVGILIGTKLPWYNSYEECRLRESKGMPNRSLYLVNNYCFDKFPLDDIGPPAEAPAAEEPVN